MRTATANETTPSRRRTRAVARLELSEDREQRKRSRQGKDRELSKPRVASESAPKPKEQRARRTKSRAKMAAVDVSLFASSSYSGDSRYLRRKKREYIHGVVAAAEIAREKESWSADVEKDEAMEIEEAMDAEEEEESEADDEDGDSLEEASSNEDRETQTAYPAQTSEKTKDQTSRIGETSPAQEECTQEEAKVDFPVGQSEPDASSAEKELVQATVETTAQMKQALNAEQASPIENRSQEKEDAKGSSAAKQAEQEQFSPDRVSVYSPLEVAAQTKLQTSVIEPTPEKSAPPAAAASKPKKNVVSTAKELMER
ncbi:hypothetical protein PHYBOEH_000732 [Phytophthora boehmeriae]|uniref:Uncharacterized protein n=1 Tax=Phytophthora boehmeriae TaxID=109152 RepID=A0A8T1X091_9STRA|nr:hypothetical protein PHYBOEH_000732 [Phytophthora boehmeriae]